MEIIREDSLSQIKFSDLAPGDVFLFISDKGISNFTFLKIEIFDKTSGIYRCAALCLDSSRVFIGEREDWSVIKMDAVLTTSLPGLCV